MTCGYCGRVSNDSKEDINAGGGAILSVCRCECGMVTEEKKLANGSVSVTYCTEAFAPDHIIKLLNEEVKHG